jgi:polyamine oxidase
VTNTFSNYSSILTYNETGYTDYSDLFDTFDEAWDTMSAAAGVILSENLQDRSTRAGLSQAGWKPKQDTAAQAVEYFNWDWDVIYTPDQSSFVFGIAGYNLTYNQYGDVNNYVWDQRGYNTWLIGEASTFLQPNDARLLFNHIVTNITYSDTEVTITMSDGSCICASYAICTFSLGVLQNDVVTFSPPLPPWKQDSIATFQMGTYTKIFLQFNETFWDRDTQYFLYADPYKRGYYPVWQSLSGPGFLEDSNIIFVTVTNDESYRVEQQDDDKTKEEVMAVLRAMFPDVDIPEPLDFFYPRWTTTPWTHGSYSNWPVGTTLEMHQNLRANVGRLWFAGEAGSAEYFGYLHGAWFEGREAGERIAGLLGKDCKNDDDPSAGFGKGGCGVQKRYEVLHGTTRLGEYDIANGWPVSSFLYFETADE